MLIILFLFISPPSLPPSLPPSWDIQVKHRHVSVSPWCFREAAILVTSVGIQKGDYGSVIVGGREIDPENIEQSVDRYVTMAMAIRR